MKNFKFVFILIFSIVFLISCGSGGTSEGTTSPNTNEIAIVNCDGSGPIGAIDDCADALDHHTCINSGDTLVRGTNSTVIEIVEVSSNKKVCVISGSAHILR